MDKLFLRDLKVDTVIGFWDWERRVKQTVSIDLEVGTDGKRAAASDSVADALNYEELARRITETVAAAQFNLVESLAEVIARIAVREFAAPWVKVLVAKPGAIRASRDVGVVIERTPADYA